MKVERIEHIHIAVKDLTKAIQFFSDILGTKFSDIYSTPEFSTKGVFSPLGLELIESTSPDGPLARFIERRGEGLQAICFKVPDIEEAIAELESRGLRRVGKLQTGPAKEAWFHPKDTFGVMIELIEYEDELRRQLNSLDSDC